MHVFIYVCLYLPIYHVKMLRELLLNYLITEDIEPSPVKGGQEHWISFDMVFLITGCCLIMSWDFLN
jgi:hypothetical protein